ncbi:MAG: hypothetical protein AB7L09_14960 [Nitrospira sp.]
MASADEGFWCPNGVDLIRLFLQRGMPKNKVIRHHTAFVGNISYHLQYLEFLNHLLTEKQLHVIVRQQTQKTFVITGMSIIEAILWYILRKEGMQKMEEWDEIGNFETSSFMNDTSELRIINTIVKKRDKPVEVEMSLDSMLKKVESKKLLGLDHQVYRKLNYLRKLRNRVHIHTVGFDHDTDWYSFSDKEVRLMKKVLHSVLSSELFKPEKEHKSIIEYLKVEESAEQLAESIPS